MKRPFLTATWSNLCLFSYVVDDARLEPFLPPGLHLDRWKGNAVVSLVAFDFLNTKVMGIPWPGFREFPEINLRFYVTDGDRRGVVFIREYVPRRFVAWLANTLYNEPYVAAPMSSEVSVTDHPDGVFSGNLETEVAFSQPASASEDLLDLLTATF